MLAMESSGRVALVNGTRSDKKLEKLAVQNGHYSPIVKSPKYKRRKVSAVRDFPPGCGRFAQQISPREETDMLVANGHENSIGEEPINGTSGLLEDLRDVVAATLREDDIPVLSDNKLFLALDGSVAVSNGNGSEKRVRKYPPRRKVSVVRDFPPNCGRNAPCLGDVELVKPRVCPESESKSSVPEESEYSRINEQTPTEAVSVDDRRTVDGVRDGDSSKRLEMRGAEITRNTVQLEVMESGLNDTTQKETGAIDTKKTADARGGSDKNNLEKIVSKVTSDVVQSKTLVESLASSKEKIIGPEKLRLVVDDKPDVVVIKTDLKQTVGDAQLKGSLEVVVSEKMSKLEGDSSKVNVNKALRESEKVVASTKKKSKLEWDGSKVHANKAHRESEERAVEAESEMKMVEKKEEKHGEPPFEDKLFWWDHEFETVVVEGNDAEGSEEDMGKEMVVYSDAKGEKVKKPDTSRNRDRMQEVASERLELPSDRVVVQGLMAKPNCPWSHGKNASTSNTPENLSARKGKKLDMTRPEVGQKTKKVDVNGSREKPQILYKTTARKKVDGDGSREKSLKKISPKATIQGKNQMVVWEEENSLLQHDKPLNVVPVSRSVEFYFPPLNPGTSGTDQDGEGGVTRRKVKETLRLYQALCRKLLQGDEGKSKEGKGRKRVDLQAASIFKQKKMFVNVGKQILGNVPGVEVGDEYQYRTELNIIGLHRQIQGGIDYVKHKGKILATSVVASGGYADEVDNSDVLIYTGQGGNVMNSDKEPEDQKLVRGNLALKNSADEKNPVRVIRGYEAGDGKSRTYVYDGLYLVEKFWQVEGPHGKLVFQFQLERIPGQPELAWKEVKKRKKCKVRVGICDDDISQGKEVIPICAVNSVDNEKPPSFNYITKMIYPDWYNPVPPEGCNCTTRCSDSEKCSCAVKNGGEIPFNHNGAIVEVKPLVFECGPACRCSSLCHNRVSQHGIKFQLEIFKTQEMGWGVRSLNFIPSGSFICEYIGELLREKDADQRTGNDEYLFDIGNNYNDNTLWDGLSNLVPEAHHVSSAEAVRDECFTIDAFKYGNVGRFINHSCTPNLYAQNILFEHDDRRFPRIMLFAAENIPPLQELTYHYNYTVDQVRDSNGDIKKKSCFCGSNECTGRLY